MRRAFLPFVIAVALLCSPGLAQAAPIQYVATDLGAGIWQYDYYLPAGSTFNALEDGFRVFFTDDYANLSIQPPATPDWDVLTTEFDPVLASLGTYDALALVDDPLFAGPFSVSFLWSGTGNPGSQPYDFYKLDASGFPDPFETGNTVPRDVAPTPVPEPSTLLLIATGLAAARKLRRTHDASAQ